jgi:hypothetical protein
MELLRPVCQASTSGLCFTPMRTLWASFFCLTGWCSDPSLRVAVRFLSILVYSTALPHLHQPSTGTTLALLASQPTLNKAGKCCPTAGISVMACSSSTDFILCFAASFPNGLSSALHSLLAAGWGCPSHVRCDWPTHLSLLGLSGPSEIVSVPRGSGLVSLESLRPVFCQVHSSPLQTGIIPCWRPMLSKPSLECGPTVSMHLVPQPKGAMCFTGQSNFRGREEHAHPKTPPFLVHWCLKLLQQKTACFIPQLEISL